MAVAMWLVGNCKNGVSSYEVAPRSEGHATNGVVHDAPHPLRHAHGKHQENDRRRLKPTKPSSVAKRGFMHADKREEKIKGRGPMGKAIVFGLLERETGKVRTSVVGTRRKHHLHATIRENVEPKAALYTDALKSYDGLDEYTPQGCGSCRDLR